MDLIDLLSNPDTREILRERARALAGRDQNATAAIGELFLQFSLGDERYSLPAAATREVLRFESIAPLPAVPPAVLGLINVRGRLVVCLDIRPLLGLAPTMPNPSMHLLIVSDGAIEAALLVDQVLAVQPQTPTLLPTPSSIAGHGVHWVLGVDEQLSIHLDPTGLLHDPRLAVDSADEPTHP
ncbi:chemotaxis protein CheW [Chloroflexus sp.]|uniref:chemotaxis protein CheW n=1 Tax=Chloroflexus sp. TaxID=1904827 RepID=UPI002606C737|nr:chemotaxis protein CheW [uncultured Chloroflexus sp.]